jgi:hypothetical protein
MTMRVTVDAASLERALKFMRPFRDAHRWDAISLSALGGEQLLVKRAGGCGAAIAMAGALIEETGAVVVEFANLFKLVSVVDGPITIAAGEEDQRVTVTFRGEAGKPSVYRLWRYGDDEVAFPEELERFLWEAESERVAEVHKAEEVRRFWDAIARAAQNAEVGVALIATSTDEAVVLGISRPMVVGTRVAGEFAQPNKPIPLPSDLAKHLPAEVLSIAADENGTRWLLLGSLDGISGFWLPSNEQQIVKMAPQALDLLQRPAAVEAEPPADWWRDLRRAFTLTRSPQRATWRRPIWRLWFEPERTVIKDADDEEVIAVLPALDPPVPQPVSFIVPNFQKLCELVQPTRLAFVFSPKSVYLRVENPADQRLGALAPALDATAEPSSEQATSEDVGDDDEGGMDDV